MQRDVLLKINYMRILDNTIDDMTDLLIKDILDETYLSKDNLKPKINAFIKHMVHNKNKPNTSAKAPTNDRTKKWMDSIQKKDMEQKFWRNLVKFNFPNEIEKFDIKLDNELLNIDGFGNVPVKFGRFLLKECKDHNDEHGMLCWSFNGQIWDTNELFEEFLEKYLS